MKISQKIKFEGDNILVEKSHDFQGEIEQVKRIRDSGMGVTGENRLVGRIPAALIYEWAREAGVDFTDQPAIAEIIKKKMLSGDFDKFKVWEGRY